MSRDLWDNDSCNLEKTTNHLVIFVGNSFAESQFRDGIFKQLLRSNKLLIILILMILTIKDLQ